PGEFAPVEKRVFEQSCQYDKGQGREFKLPPFMASPFVVQGLSALPVVCHAPLPPPLVPACTCAGTQNGARRSTMNFRLSLLFGAALPLFAPTFAKADLSGDYKVTLQDKDGT